MSREFQILGTIVAREQFRTPTSASFDIVSHMKDLPTASSWVGSIDVHGPCEGSVRLRGTITIDLDVLRVENEPIPSFDLIRERVIDEFELKADDLWSFKYLEVREGYSVDNYSWS